MRICKQVKDIHSKTLEDLMKELNEALLEGAEIVAVDIQSLTALITVTEYVGEIEKTELDLLEEEFGCHNCAECPFFEVFDHAAADFILFDVIANYVLHFHCLHIV